MTTKLAESNIESATLALLSGISVSNVISTNSSFEPLGTNQVSTSGGFLKISGLNFANGTQVFLESSGVFNNTSTSYVSATELNCTVPALGAGYYNAYVCRADGAYAIKIRGVEYA